MKLPVLIAVIFMSIVFDNYAHAANQPHFVKASKKDFSQPHDLCLDPLGEKLYVADMQNNVVKVLNPTSLVTLAVIGEGELAAPHDVAFNAKGELMVADSGHHRIVIYSVGDGEVKRVRVVQGGLNSPEGVVELSNGDMLISNAWGHNVVVFSQANKPMVFGGKGRAELQFHQPHDVAQSPRGQIYIGDPGNHRIQILTSTLKFDSAFKGNEKRPLREPKYLSLDENGWLYVADQGLNAVLIFDDKLQLKTTITASPERNLNGPEGIYARSKKIWLADTHNDQILLYSW